MAGGTFGGGSGTSASPYLVEDAADLNNVRNHLDCNYIQMADIDLSGYSPWVPLGGGGKTAGVPGFSGSYDGNCFKITGLIVNGNPLSTNNSDCGLFGFIDYSDSGVEFKNMFLENVNITGAYEVGGIAGEATSGNISFSNCCVTGSISAIGYAGGITGELYGSMDNCYSLANITVTESDAGGLLADFDAGSITNCYSAGVIMGPGGLDNYVGSLIGWKHRSATVNDSYYDSETSGQSSSDGGTPKTTAEMKSQSTFEGWDFDDVWGISPDINDGYPYLQMGYPVSLPQVKQPVWADYKLTWEDAADALSYIVRLYNAAGVVSTQVVAPGVKLFDFSSILSVGTFTATVQASEVAPE